MMTDITKQFRLYAPQSTKSYTTSDDGGLIIEGIASTTNKDLTGDVVLPSAIQSMKQQLTTTTKNLHGDHKYGLDGILGVIREVVETDDDKLVIRAAIRKTYAPAIKEMLDLGVNLGLSIGGNVKEYNPIRDGWEIKDIELFEISLTGMPANWDTYGTITTTSKNNVNGGVVESKCLAGACHLIRKQLEVQKMPEENKPQPQNNENNVEVLTVEEATNLFNELMADKQKEIANQTLETVRNEMDKVIRDTVEEIIGDKKDDDEEPPATKTKEEEVDEEKIKSIIETTLNKSLDGFVNSFFKEFNNGRAPAPQATKAIHEAEKEEGLKAAEETKKTFTPEEAAQQLFKKNNSQSNMLLNVLNQQ